MSYPNSTIFPPASQPVHLPGMEANPWADTERCLSYEDWARQTDGGQYDLDGPFSKDGFRQSTKPKRNRKRK